MSSPESTGAMPVESSKSAMSWGPIIGGAVSATGVTLISSSWFRRRFDYGIALVRRE